MAEQFFRLRVYTSNLPKDDDGDFTEYYERFVAVVPFFDVIQAIEVLYGHKGVEGFEIMMVDEIPEDAE